MKQIISKIKSCYHLIRVAIRPEKNIKSVVFIGEKVGEYTSSRISASKLYQNKEMQAMYNERYGIAPLSLTVLLDNPENSLGMRLAKFYHSQGLNFYSTSCNIKIKRNQYIYVRIRKLHDFIHLTMGYEKDLEGKAQVNAFVANQTRMPFPLLITIFIILKTLISNPNRFYPLMDKIISAWQESARCKNFLTYSWEDKLDQPFANIVQEFNKNEVTQTQLNPSSIQCSPIFNQRNSKFRPISFFEINYLRPEILM